ncbi:MAG: hypothetical protein HN855_10735 [Anaerolineae bacterium]|jgi:hypothetical protein|nr:hypothetical protein [Anaerolineae bacterium]MBT7325628.1 hypothetical protein [Anaerolineae bacterium]
MNAENELTFHTKKSMPLPLKSLWRGFWRIVITGATLACIYYLFALWGVILLVILAGRQVRAVLHREAQRNP